MTSEATQELIQEPVEESVREELVHTAVNFLTNKNVVRTPLGQKQKFLQSKGLSNKEIQLACERAGAYDVHENAMKHDLVLQRPPSQALMQPLGPPSLFQQVRDIFHTTAVFTVVIYAAYKFYQKYIKPFLFGKTKSIEEQVDDLEKKLSDSVVKLNESVVAIKDEVEKIGSHSDSSNARLLQNLQSEVSIVKGLLLSRKSFPSPVSNTVVPPSIPAWQLSSAAAEPDHDPKTEDLLEVGSGSGSEPDNRTKNSDSSLEIM